ncbi:hypothetical protein ACJX0J_040569, partial [Zea mays]
FILMLSEGIPYYLDKAYEFSSDRPRGVIVAFLRRPGVVNIAHEGLAHHFHIRIVLLSLFRQNNAILVSYVLVYINARAYLTSIYYASFSSIWSLKTHVYANTRRSTCTCTRMDGAMIGVSIYL